MRKLTDFILRKGGLFLVLPLALSLSPVGLAVAAGMIGSLDIIDGGVKTVDLGKAAVTKAKLAKNSVTSAKIADGSVTGFDIANSAVNSAKILDGQITNADIAGGAAIAASKINRAGLDADLLDGVDSAALVKNNTAADQGLAGKLSAPDFAYSPAKTGALTIPAIGSSIVGTYTIGSGAEIYASEGTAVDWYAPVHLPKGATITGFSHYTLDAAGGQMQAELYNWWTPIASVYSTTGLWHLDSTSTIAPGYETSDENAPYHVNVRIEGGNGIFVKSGYVRINYTYTSPGN